MNLDTPLFQKKKEKKWSLKTTRLITDTNVMDLFQTKYSITYQGTTELVAISEGDGEPKVVKNQTKPPVDPCLEYLGFEFPH